MGYSSASHGLLLGCGDHAVTPVRQPPGPGALRNLILRAIRGAIKRLAAVDVHNRPKSVKSKVNVQVASAQRALASNKLEPPVKTRPTICCH
jgi:hypothetical protein